MRFTLCLLAMATMVMFLACRTASSSTAKSVEIKNEKAESPKAHDKPEEMVKRSGNVTEDAHEHDGDEVERITIEDAKKAVDAGEAIIVDARSNNAYNTEHIEGSINIPAGEMEKRYKEIPKNKKIIVYCS